MVVALVLHTRGHPFDPEEVKSLLNIDGSSKKYKEDIDRKERKYQHYLEKIGRASCRERVLRLV